MNQVEFNTFLINQSKATEVHADLFSDGSLMCGHYDNNIVHVYREDGLLHRLDYIGDTIIKHDAKDVWNIYELCSASKHFAKTTDYDFATVISGMSDFTFNFSPREVIDGETNSLPKREELKISVANQDALAKIRGEFHNVIELIEDQNLELQFLIEDSLAKNKTKTEIAFNGDKVPHYKVCALRSHVMTALEEDDLNYKFADLVLELKSAFWCLEHTYLNASKRDYIDGKFDESHEIFYSKEQFVKLLDECRRKSHEHNEDCSLSTEFIDQVFNTIEKMADTFMTAC
ncbi:hypothetical protein H8Q88_20340 [Vibrio metschnikovii]|uniref:Uncharacterized protein n=2 Tax=Vibrio metschnikovii TaxID=28172 RepID=A0A9X0RDD6_VIBME|nr:hypothetical protein [Vibrio metschnikovii]